MAFRLNDPLITSFEYQGIEHPIKLSYDNVLDCLEVYENQTLEPDARLEVIMEWLFGEEQNLSSDAFEQYGIWEEVVQTIVNKDENVVEYDLEGNVMDKPTEEYKEQLIDLAHDAELIYSGFLQAYGIDLIEEQGKLHWTKFIALLHGLPEETPIKKVMNIRGANLSEIKDKSMREQLRRQKEAVKIPKERG